MTPQELISIAVEAGYEVMEYDNHYVVQTNLNVSVVVTIPKVTYLVSYLVDKIKGALGI